MIIASLTWLLLLGETTSSPNPPMVWQSLEAEPQVQLVKRFQLFKSAVELGLPPAYVEERARDIAKCFFHPGLRFYSSKKQLEEMSDTFLDQMEILIKSPLRAHQRQEFDKKLSKFQRDPELYGLDIGKFMSENLPATHVDMMKFLSSAFYQELKDLKKRDEYDEHLFWQHAWRGMLLFIVVETLVYASKGVAVGSKWTLFGILKGLSRIPWIFEKFFRGNDRVLRPPVSPKRDCKNKLVKLRWLVEGGIIGAGTIIFYFFNRPRASWAQAESIVNEEILRFLGNVDSPAP